MRMYVLRSLSVSLFYTKQIFIKKLLLNSLEYFRTISAVYSIHTRHKYNNNSQLTMLSCFGTVLIVLESKSLSLPHNLKIIMVENENFKTALKRQLNMHSLYLTDEF